MRGRAWLVRRLREAAYALSDAPLALLGLLCLAGCLAAGTALLVVVLGVGLLAVGLAGARAWGRLELARARVLLGMRLPPPAEPVVPPVSSVEWLRAALTDGRGWRAVGYVVLKVPLAALTTSVALAGYGGAVAGLSYPAWAGADPMVFGSVVLNTPGRIAGVAAAGLVLLGLTPLVLVGPLAISKFAVAGLLGPSRPGRRLRALEQARGQALTSTAAELRRIERDLHDGTQARLVTLAMDLGLARELVDTETAETLSTVLAGAHRNAQQALAELRGIVSTIHPPALDAGLAQALEALAEAIAVPVSVEVRLRRRPAPPIETIVYYCAAELLGNVVKHSGAGTATVTVAGERRWLTLRVHDDGRGGAAARHGPSGDGPADGGTGLSGLAARVGAVDGTFEIDSPPGGPTVVTVGVPVQV